MRTHLVRVLCSDDGGAFAKNVDGGGCDDSGDGGNDVGVVVTVSVNGHGGNYNDNDEGCCSKY